jgi:Cu-Zn family superoxide dismutase
MVIKTFLILILISQAFSKEARCYMIPDRESGISGYITFSQEKDNDPVQIEMNVFGTTKVHGFHIHENGNIQDGCMSAGAHFNPLNMHHGAPNATERHIGDLGNIISKSGSVRYTFKDSTISLFGKNEIIGRACVVHERMDDLGLGGNPESLKTGNAGGRIACGTVQEYNTSMALFFGIGIVSIALIGGVYMLYFRKNEGYEALKNSN